MTTSSYDHQDILHRLMNRHPNNYSDIELLRLAAEEIKKLRAVNAEYKRRYDEMVTKVESLQREQFHE